MQPVLPSVERSVDAMRAPADAEGVSIVLDGGVAVSAPIAPELLRRAVDNLLDNALRYSPPGGTVAVTVSEDDGAAVIDVVDDGPGFPPGFLPHAFERFRRADDARSRAAGGAGLGLAIVLAIARTHGGDAQVANLVPHGAWVTMRLPTVCE